jgi:hypothetical protein
MDFIKFLLGQHDRIQKLTHKDVYALCNFNHHMNTIKYLGRMQGSPRMNLMSHKAFKCHIIIYTFKMHFDNEALIFYIYPFHQIKLVDPPCFDI